MGRSAERATGERAIDKMRLQQLKGHHRSMARDVAAGGLRNVELARLYNMKEAQISIIINSPIFIAEVARIEDDLEEQVVELREELRMIAPRAKRILAETLASDDLVELGKNINARKFQTSVAQDVLDRAGAGKPSGQDGGLSYHLHLSKTEEKHVHLMSEKELREDVFDLVKED